MESNGTDARGRPISPRGAPRLPRAASSTRSVSPTRKAWPCATSRTVSSVSSRSPLPSAGIYPVVTVALAFLSFGAALTFFEPENGFQGDHKTVSFLAGMGKRTSVGYVYPKGDMLLLVEFSNDQRRTYDCEFQLATI